MLCDLVKHCRKILIANSLLCQYGQSNREASQRTRSIHDGNTLESGEQLLLAANEALGKGCYVAFRIKDEWFDIYASKDEAVFEDALNNWAIQGVRHAISIGTGYKTS